MNRKKLLNIFFFAIFTGSGLYGIIPGFSRLIPLNGYQQDTTKENQILYNGKMWINLHFYVKGDQFLYSKDFLDGSVTINGKTYKNIGISYDIYNDEIITTANRGLILQLNKEMVDSFTVDFGNKTNKFINIPEDNVTGISGYVNVLYNGKSGLYVKYRKEIALLALDGKYDLFIQTHRIYLLKDGNVYPINTKKDLLKVLNKDNAQIKDYIKKNRLKVSKKEPASFIPIIRYYDSISQ